MTESGMLFSIILCCKKMEELNIKNVRKEDFYVVPERSLSSES